MKAYAPTGALIVATLEKTISAAPLDVEAFDREPDSTLSFDHSGGEELWCSDLETVTRAGRAVFIDDAGDEWTEDQIRLEGEPRPHLWHHYKRLRAKTWTASEAYEAAAVHQAWHDVNGGVWFDVPNIPDIGPVRLLILEDCHRDPGDIAPTDATPEEVGEIMQRVADDGLWGVAAQIKQGDAWEFVDSVWGFIGDDWRDSGYDVDLMRAALDAHRALSQEHRT